MFADRTRWDLTPNPFTLQKEALQKKGVTILDLTVSNPTHCGFRYPGELLAPWAHQGSLIYEPSPKGLLPAREAVASLYAQKGIQADPNQILLTASTSEAYSFLLRLLCNPGDSILVPSPSYPLFDYLTGLQDVQPADYSLRYTTRWEIDFDSLSKAILADTRAVVVVHPNNPTGSCLTHGELDRLVQLCKKHQMALISDEVFAEYLYEQDSVIPRSLLAGTQILTFGLGGLSKFLGLPQMKLAWILTKGPASLVHLALERLELIADTYLSVNTPVQQALPGWLEGSLPIQSQIRQRLEANRQYLMKRLNSGAPAQLLAADGGWSAVLRVPSIQDEEAWALELLNQAHVLVYPGYFFDFEKPGFLVVSLLVPLEVFQEGITRLLSCLAA